MGGGAEREVGVDDQPVIGDHAVSGGEHVGEIGPHAAVHGDRSPDPQGRSGAGGQGGVGADADDDQDHVGQPGHRAAISGGGLDLQPSRFAAGAGDLPDCAAGQDLDAAVGELAVDQGAERRVDGGQDLG